MGFPHVVALMGWVMSEEQTEIITKIVPPSGRVWMIPDGDESGRRCSTSVLEHVSPVRSLRWLKMDEGKQPTDYPGGWYRERFGK
jgi:DNA primase